MSAFERKREEFREYLESAGAIDNLTKALVKLYEESSKPKDATSFIRREMCSNCHDEEQYETLAAELERANRKVYQLEKELMRIRGSLRKSTSETDLMLSNGLEELEKAESMLSSILKKGVFDALKGLKTNFKGNLLDCVQAGLLLPESPIGTYACDAEAYQTFSMLFDPMIETLHGFKKEGKHPETDWGDSCKLPELENEFVKQITIKCSRNIDGYPFQSLMSFNDYEDIFKKFSAIAKPLCKASTTITAEPKGEFVELEILTDADQNNVFESLSITNPMKDRELTAAAAARFWPIGRGYYKNLVKNYTVFCNHEDHLEFSASDDESLKNTYDALIAGVSQFSKNLPMMRDERLGFLTFSPINLGNTLRVCIRIKLDKLPIHAADEFDEIATKFNMEIKKLPNGMYEIESKKRLGVTEFETVKNFADGIIALIDEEKSL